MARRRAWYWVPASVLAVGCASAAPGHRMDHASAHTATPAPSVAATWFPAGQLPAANAALSVAPYFVTLAAQRQDEPAVVTDALTGAVLGIVRAPAGSTGFTGVAAAGDDRTFVLAAQPSAATTRFYELRLGPDGQAGALVTLPVPALASGGAFAVSADGTKLAIATSTANSAGIDVVSLAAQSVRTWKAPAGYVTDLSWAGNRMLAFQWWDGSRSARVARARSGVRLLDTAAAGSDLLASRLILKEAPHTWLGTFTDLAYPLISEDGSKLFATTLWGGPSHSKAEVVEFSALTGKALAVVAPAEGESGTGSWCGALWTDPSGSQAAAVCAGQGRIVGGRFVGADLHAPTYDFSTPRVSFIAW
jgi:hypothetical protein